MGGLENALRTLKQFKEDRNQQTELSFTEFLQEVVERPERNIRNVAQVYADMVHHYVSAGEDEYPGDPESINFLHYDCSGLFVEGSDRPFFADRLFANRLIRHVESLSVGDQRRWRSQREALLRVPEGGAEQEERDRAGRRTDATADRTRVREA